MPKYVVIISLLAGFTPLFAATPVTGVSLPVAFPDSTAELAMPLSSGGTSLVSNAGVGEATQWITAPKAVDVRVVTGYSSTPEETDDTPFITASGGYVHTGTAAANWLPMGTKIRIPEIFGDKIFTIEDRMHPRNAEKVDIWFPEKSEALRFGSRLLRIEIL